MYTFLAINDAHPEHAMYVATEKSAYCGFYPVSDPSEIDGSSITDERHRAVFAGHVLRLASETYNELMFIFGEMSTEASERDEIRSLIAEHGFYIEADAWPVIAVAVWGRDCDCCESTSMRVIPATIEDYEELYEDISDGAEGPFTLRILSEREALDFEPTTWDRALEAFENGNTYNV